MLRGNPDSIIRINKGVPLDSGPPLFNIEKVKYPKHRICQEFKFVVSSIEIQFVESSFVITARQRWNALSDDIRSISSIYSGQEFKSMY